MTMEKWAVGVFTSIDAGLGLPLDIAKEIGVQTIQMHAPARTTRTEQQARQMLDTLAQYEIELTAVFGGFDGESYADIPTVERTVGLVPPETRAERLDEMKHIADYAQDYLKIKELALKEKQLKAIEAWQEEKIDDTYIKINGDYRNCDFASDWLKQN